MSAQLTFTILGCGSSMGVPRADGGWGACDPAEPRNQRRRCSLLAQRFKSGETDPTTVLIDSAPDFREQAIAAKITRIDALLMTHDHADQSHGIDDLRIFYLRQKRPIPCHMDSVTFESLTTKFQYIFDGRLDYPAVCQATLIPPHGLNWAVEGPGGTIPVTTFDQVHGPIHSVGYRLGNVAYSPDVNVLDDAAFAALSGLDVWVLDAIRWAPHPTHANVETALGWIDRVKPKRAILTNLHLDLDYHALAARLPSGVEPAYDGMVFESLVAD